jgi:hypothetical protein
MLATKSVNWLLLLKILHACTNPRRLVARATKLFTVAPNVFSIITAAFTITYKKVYPFTCTELDVPDVRDVQMSLQNCGSSVRNTFHVTLLATRICRYRLDFWKMYVP